MREKAGSSRKTSPSEDMEGYEEEKFRGRGCGCLRKYCFTRRQNNSESQSSQWALLQTQEEGEKSTGENWLKKKVSKENFVRRFRLMINKKKRRRTHDQFHYDPQSYALNFDDGDNRGTDFDLH